MQYYDRSVFFRTLDDENTPGFRVFFYLGIGIGFFAFFGAWGTWGIEIAFLVTLAVVATAYLIGVIVNFAATAVERVADDVRRRFRQNKEENDE